MRIVSAFTPRIACSVFAVLFAFTGCSPDYPLCSDDDDCQVEDHLGDVCVNGTCQECLEDAQCVARKGDGYYCNTGRCDPKPAPPPAPGCTADTDCPETHVCSDGACIPGSSQDDSAATQPAGCVGDFECNSGERCVGGSCVAGGDSSTLASSKNCQRLIDANARALMKPILFDFDDYQLTDASRSALSETADCLRDFPARIVIEGHCDERGTQEYNLALGEKRASMVRSYLRTMGLDPT